MKRSQLKIRRRKQWQLENIAKSGNYSASQVSQAAFKAGVDPADRARLTAQASANKKDSKADKARQAANVAVSEVLASGNAPDLTQYKDTSRYILLK